MEYPLLGALRAAARATRRYGWVSAKTAKERGTNDSTADRVRNYYNPDGEYRHNGERVDPSGLRHTDEIAQDVETAEATIAWMNEIAPRSEYEQNLVNLAKIEDIYERDFGIAVSAVSGYQRHIARIAEREMNEKAMESSEHVGIVGKRMKDLEVQVLAVRLVEGYMGGASQLVTMLANGNVLKSFYSGSHAFASGERVKIAATVK